jgi:hypothetical protein
VLNCNDLSSKAFLLCILYTVARSMNCEVDRLKYGAALVLVQLMDQVCVRNDRSDLRYSNGTCVAIISYQGELKSPSWLITAFVIGASTAWITVRTFYVHSFFSDKGQNMACTASFTATLFFSNCISYFTFFGVGLINLSDPSVLQASVSDGFTCFQTRDRRIVKPLPTHDNFKGRGRPAVLYPCLEWDLNLQSHCSHLRPPGHFDCVLH